MGVGWPDRLCFWPLLDECSCLENPRDVGAWWAAVCGVAQSWTRLKRLSSSSRWVLGEKAMAIHSSQCSCMENPRDGGAWWAAIYGVAQSWTRLKRLSSSSSRWILGFPGGKEPTCQCRRHKKGSIKGFNHWVRKIPRRRAQQPTLIFLPRESRGQRILVQYGP